MSIYGAHATPDVPLFRMDEVHEMQSQLLHHAENALGPCTHDFEIMPARFVMGTTGCAIRSGNKITIDLEENAARDWQCCVAELGHELVHALDGLTGHPTWLEEGIACAFGLGQCAPWFGDMPLYLCKGAYREAMLMVATVPGQMAVVKHLRGQGIRMCSVTPAQLMAAAPGLDETKAVRLCERFSGTSSTSH